MERSSYTPEEIAQKGRCLYEERLRDQLERDHLGEVAVINVDTGEYEVDPDHLRAARRARAAHPGAALYALRIGQPALARIGGRSVAKPS